MKKLILGIIAVFLIEIGFITYLNLDASADPAVAEVNNNIIAPGRDLSIFDVPNEVTSSAEPDSPPRSSPEPQRVKWKAAKVAPLARRAARRIRPAMGPNHVLSARAIPHRPRVRVAPRRGYHTLVQREYFGRMVVEVTYRVYDFRPKNSRTRKSAFLA